MNYKIIVGTAAFIMNEDKVLIVRRSKQEDFLPGVYELPGGGVEYAEDPYITIEREILEEVNLKIKALRPFHTWNDIFDNTKDQYIEIDFLVEVEDDLKNIKLSHEHDDYQWIRADEVENYNISEKVKYVIQLGFKELANSKL